MTIQEKYNAIIQYFQLTMPDPKTELDYKNGFELAVAVILSAQCTDKRVNQITPILFHHLPDAEHMAHASIEEITNYIRQCSYPNNKAKHLSGMAKKLVSDYQGKLPDNTEALMTLPGVGRKTANVLASVLYNIPVFPVDTHVFRVANRIGLSPKTSKLIETEEKLTAHFPRKLIPKAHHWLILHGRYTCKARKPLCEKCGLTKLCTFYLQGKPKNK